MWQWRMDAGHENGWNKGYTMLFSLFSSFAEKRLFEATNLIFTYPKEGDILLHLKLMACKTTTLPTFITRHQLI